MPSSSAIWVLVPNDPIAEGLIRVCQQAKQGEMRTTAVDVQPVPFNTSLDEFAPSYYGHGVLFASARKGRKKAAKGKTNIASSDTDIYLALPGNDGQMSRVENSASASMARATKVPRLFPRILRRCITPPR
jgi:hypothetical protein